MSGGRPTFGETNTGGVSPFFWSSAAVWATSAIAMVTNATVELAATGAFGIKIPVEYGGLGLSQMNYSRAAMLVGGHCANTTALLSAHQSIGVPQPLKLFGSEEQKRRFFPRLARGEISAFALTEVDVGSDPARMKTRAEPTPDGKHFILNGEKLWCTNGVKAGLFVVMAQTPPKLVGGKERTLLAHLIALDNLYKGHIAVEDRELFPAAGRVLTADELGAVGREMAARRNVAYRIDDSSVGD